jgi:hypothetical protein
MVVVGAILVLGANGLVFNEAAIPLHPLPALKGITVISLLWMFAGAWGTCARKLWARYLMLAILYVGSLGFFLTGIITLAMDDGPLLGRLQPIFIATALYLFVSLVLTHSKHVRRLTSRAWE